MQLNKSGLFWLQNDEAGTVVLSKNSYFMKLFCSYGLKFGYCFKVPRLTLIIRVLGYSTLPNKNRFSGFGGGGGGGVLSLKQGAG